MAKSTLILKDDARIGIANRGEAAIRFIRAVRDYNRLYGTRLETVAFYIDREKDSLFVQEADAAYPLSGFSGTGPGTGSPYLNRRLMLEALTVSGCSGVWVGWGFLSEDAEFVALLEKARLVFLGPSSEAMALLGDKIAAKALAERSDVPICPWSKGPVETLAAARGFAEKIGYPVIIKAANAGGGRGIRFVPGPEDLAGAYKSAVDETLRITGNTVVFIERLVEKGRHLEVQVLADRHGTIHTFGVRDCSIQRKNQKIIEETPPANFDPAVVKAMEAAASRLIKAAAYESAATVEFLYDLHRKEFYFMEVNTRLQVEHPITEQLYGIDLVRGQILVARNENLSAWNATPRGAVVEVRLNAEDPNRDFRPAPGRVVRFKAPSGPGIRVDSGIDLGSEIPPDFDSMVAKIIAYGHDRPAALARLERALTEMRIKIEGGTTNRAFLSGLLRNPEIRKGGVHTRFVEELLASGKTVVERKDWPAALAAAAVEQYIQRYGEDFANFSQQMFTFGSPRSILPSAGYEAQISARGRQYKFLVRSLGDDVYHLSGDGGAFALRYRKKGEESFIFAGGARYHIQIVERGDTVQVEVNGVPYEIETETGGVVKAPSPALVLSVAAAPGRTVKKGDILVTLEAMKMEMIVPSPEEGIVRDIRVKPGEQVGAGQVLLLLDPAGKKDEGAEHAEKAAALAVSFKDLKVRGADADWDLLCGEYRAVFSGYDSVKNAKNTFTAMEGFIKAHPEYRESFARTVLEGIELFTAVEGLFTGGGADPEGAVRPAVTAELLSHYFKRTMDREKGLPEDFLKALERVFDLYLPGTVSRTTEQVRNLIFRLFRSRAAGPLKQDLLLAVLSVFEGPMVPAGGEGRIRDLLDNIALLAQTSRPSLADAAINARYRLFDREILKKIQEEKRARVGRILDLLSRAKRHGNFTADLMGRISDLGDPAVDDLAKYALGTDAAVAGPALEALGRRINRDRTIVSAAIKKKGVLRFCAVRCADEEGLRESVTAVIEEKNFEAGLSALGDYIEASGTEVVLYVTARKDIPLKTLERAVKGLKKPAAWICIGVLCPEGPRYRTWTPDAGKKKAPSWVLDEGWMGFHPLAYRELRIFRLRNFAVQLIKAGEGFYLVHGTARDNGRDERLVALMEVATTRAEFTPDGAIGRMVVFENVFMDAVYALRSEQIKRRNRLHWNRIIIHIRPVLNVSLALIQDYARRLAARTLDLGMERLVIYCRLLNPETKKIEEKELLFDNIEGRSFTLSSRIPARVPMRTMDAYVAKVVRARQRGTVYPYEMVKMLTTQGAAGKDGLLPGEFEEFDLAEGGSTPGAEAVSLLDSRGMDKTYRSVAGRPFGKNEGNVVFGLIANRLPDGRLLRRVIILSDPTSDLGSLAEAECRRVIAALDLAQDLGIPAEYLPVSAGARIDMDSGTENLDWTAAVLRRIIAFTQRGGELNIIVAGINVGAQSYWNAEATMLMHTRGLLIMTDEASMLLTGKKALDFSGSVSAEDNVGIGGAHKIMGPNGQAQIRARDLIEAYEVLFRHYALTYTGPGRAYPERLESKDPVDRDVGIFPYRDFLNQGFETIGDIFGTKLNPERKKPFDIRQVMGAVIDQDLPHLERWGTMRDAETSVVWEARIGGYAAALIGIESRVIPRQGEVPHDGPESWSGGTLFPMGSKKTARAVNAFSGRLPLVILANLSGFDGSPESLRKLQLEYGAEIGRAVVNFRGPIVFVVIARYHGGAYVVFSKQLNPNLHAAALEGAYASVIGGAPAAAVVFPSLVLKDTYGDPEVVQAGEKLKSGTGFSQKDYDELFRRVHGKKQAALAARFDKIHSVERARKVGSIDAIISVKALRPYIVERIERGLHGR
jgi:acetyl/propionyl-CoA carboxylase alpha subunit/acetyl-CoA carboxylase carboxyltransferase component